MRGLAQAARGNYIFSFVVGVRVVSGSGFSPLFLVVRALLRYVVVSRGVVAFRVVLLFSPLFACAVSLLFFLILEQVMAKNSVCCHLGVRGHGATSVLRGGCWCNFLPRGVCVNAPPVA
jgi:hypothetical protein